MENISFHPCSQDPPLLIRVPGKEKERAQDPRNEVDSLLSRIIMISKEAFETSKRCRIFFFDALKNFSIVNGCSFS